MSFRDSTTVIWATSVDKFVWHLVTPAPLIEGDFSLFDCDIDGTAYDPATAPRFFFATSATGGVPGAIDSIDPFDYVGDGTNEELDIISDVIICINTNEPEALVARGCLYHYVAGSATEAEPEHITPDNPAVGYWKCMDYVLSTRPYVFALGSLETYLEDWSTI